MDNTYLAYFQLRQATSEDFDYQIPFIFFDKDPFLCYVDSQNSTREPDTVYVYSITTSEEKNLFKAQIHELYVIDAQDIESPSYVKPSQWIHLYNMDLVNCYLNFRYKKSKYKYMNNVFVIDDLNNYSYSEIFENRGKQTQKHIQQFQSEIYQIEHKYNVKLTTLETVYHAFMNGINSGIGFNSLSDSHKEKIWQEYRPQYIEDYITKYYDSPLKITLNSALRKVLLYPYTVLSFIVVNLILLVVYISTLFSDLTNIIAAPFFAPTVVIITVIIKESLKAYMKKM
jgi:hypothetical protein